MITEVQSQSAKPATKRKRGFTLTEIAIVLGIIGLILGAIWAAASSVYANLKANQAQQGVLAAAQAVRSLYATSANTNVVDVNITSPGMFPTNWVSSAGVGITGNPWHVNPPASFAYVNGNGQLFAIEIDGISDTGCAQLVGFYSFAASGANGGQVPGLVGNNYKVTAGGATGGTSSFTNKVQGKAGTLPVLPVAAADFYNLGAGVCAGGNLADNVEILFNMSIM